MISSFIIKYYFFNRRFLPKRIFKTDVKKKKRVFYKLILDTNRLLVIVSKEFKYFWFENFPSLFEKKIDRVLIVFASFFLLVINLNTVLKKLLGQFKRV